MVISQTAHGVLASERAGAGAAGARGERELGGTAEARAAGAAGRGGPARRRWLPPAARAAVPSDAHHDAVFRKVRGILNKLTPEKFGKLGDDLLALELDSDKVLKGVILLIFDKALDEPKYSSMYAQLCKRLSEQAPNLEPPGQPCTFKLLLLNKCRTEFENRAQAFAAFEDRALQPEEEEKRHLAKCKMLGNIKFIGELGKLEILSESILHRCIQNLLARRAAAEHHEDLECLAQLVRTCGRVLDSERGRGLMDQYFARIETLSQSRELAPRIRFMLRDVAELRRGGWVPRAATHGEGPVPIQQLRRDDEPPPRRQERDALFRARGRPLDDVLAGLSLAAPAAALVAPPPDKLFGNGFPPQRDAFRQRGAPGYYRGAGSYGKQGGGGGKEPAPRFNKSRLAAAGTLEDVQMRPAANSLLFTANRLSKPPATPLPLAPAQQSVLPPTFASTPPLLKEPAITIKPAPDKKDKPKKDKGMDKEEAVRLALAELKGLAELEPPAAGAEGAPGPGPGAGEEPPALRAAAEALQQLALPDKLLRRALAALLEHALAGHEDSSPWASCALVARVKRAPVAEPLRALVAARHPHAALPALLAHAVTQKLVSLGEVGGMCEGGAHYPLLLQTLQRLLALLGLERLQQLYNESKINICAYVSEGGGGAEGAAGAEGADAGAAVEAHGLGALEPALRLQAALARQLQAEPAPAALYRWIKAHVEPGVRAHAAFVSALVALLAAHVSRAAESATGAPPRAALERERALLEAYAPLLRALLGARPDLQLQAVYAVQVHAHHHNYPKGMLLRWFMYLYNLEVCEEDAFLRWREDVTDAYPGKGEALFQVNTWLTWLQQQESEDEETED